MRGTYSTDPGGRVIADDALVRADPEDEDEDEEDERRKEDEEEGDGDERRVFGMKLSRPAAFRWTQTRNLN